MDFHHRKINPISKLKDIATAAKHALKDIGFHCPPPPPKHDGDFSKSIHLLHTLIISACAAITILIICVVFIQLKKLKSRRNSIRQRNPPILFAVQEDPDAEDRGHGPEIDHPIWYINFVGLHQSVIDSIMVCKYRKEEGLIEGTDCSICLSEFEENEDLRLLPKCSHAFHIPCIDTWLRSHKNCPLCRAPIVHDSAGAQSAVGVTRSNSNDTSSVLASQVGGLVESGRDGENEAIQSRVGQVFSAEDGRVDEFPVTDLPDSNMRRCHSRILSDLVDRRGAVEDDVHPVRRSVSMDPSSASTIYTAVAKLNSGRGISENLSGRGCTSFNSTGKSAAVAKRASGSWSICKRNSIGRSLQKGPLSVKRSFSSGRKFLASRHCRSQSSHLPSTL